MIGRLLVANRGEIACRIFATCERLGIAKLAVYSEADEQAEHVRRADEAVAIGGARPADSYLDADRLIDAAVRLGADAIHPGYGFLSEDATFAQRVVDAGMTWVGPSPETMSLMADKLVARATATELGVPVVPGSEGSVDDVESAVAAAERIGYPVILKASGGGGGIGMEVAHDEERLRLAYETTRSTSERFFGRSALFLERYVQSAKHVEVQVVGLPGGHALVIGDRDCSVQRRNQKVLEEAPCPALTAHERQRAYELAARLAEGVGYLNAGTIELLFDQVSREFFFLEMNTRLQVEHPITELVTGIDLVAAQLAIASGLNPDLPPHPAQRGHAVELRVYAEDPVKFLPGPGQLTRWVEPRGDGIRVDSGYRQGDTVTPFYDPLMAKLCAWGPDRTTALARLAAAATEFQIEGPRHNLTILDRLLADSAFVDGQYDTRILTPPNRTTKDRTPR